MLPRRNRRRSEKCGAYMLRLKPDDSANFVVLLSEDGKHISGIF